MRFFADDRSLQSTAPVLDPTRLGGESRNNPVKSWEGMRKVNVGFQGASLGRREWA